MTDNTDFSSPKLCDFGLSKVLDPNNTQVDSLGTLGYSAPEIVLHQPSGLKSDCWSLGCLIYALFSGRLPFFSEDREETKKLTVSAELDLTYSSF